MDGLIKLPARRVRWLSRFALGGRRENREGVGQTEREGERKRTLYSSHILTHAIVPLLTIIRQVVFY